MDALKGSCILLVVFTHYKWTNEQRLAGGFPLWVNMAVPLFLIVSGYVGAGSVARNHVERLRDMYRVELVARKLVRYTVPYVIMYVIEVIIRLYSGVQLTVMNECKLILQGGIGPGSYYFPFMIQFVFVFPLIYSSVVERPRVGLIIWFILNFIFELLGAAYELPTITYRLLVFRYVFLIAVGVFVYVDRGTVKPLWLVLCFAAGISYVLLMGYCEYEPHIINESWMQVSFPVGLYVGPVFYLMVRYLPNVGNRLMCLLGKASYHIFLAQMVYFTYALDCVYPRLAFPWDIMCNIVVCCVVGLCFYWLEKPFGRFALNITLPVAKKLEEVLGRLDQGN